jgi:RimJ/RimL family protein N-acetyltransferase
VESIYDLDAFLRHFRANEMIVIQSTRLRLSQFQITDAEEVFACITPSITRFMRWEPPSWSEYIARCEQRLQDSEINLNTFSFVIRRRDSKECLGMTAVEACDTESPELGLWMKESAHGQGFGREVVSAVAEWAHKTLGKESFIYPVAVQNIASRRIAEGLHGEIIENRTSPKYESVVYKIPWKG